MARAIVEVLCGFLKLGSLFLRQASAIRAENLGLRKRLAIVRSNCCGPQVRTRGHFQ
jgi:hypothetical protein